MHLLVHITNLVSVQLNHYQFLFLMRLTETMSEITTFLTQDVSHILGKEKMTWICIQPTFGKEDFLFIDTVKLGIKELLNKEQTGFKELFTDYIPSLLYHKSTFK